MANVIRKKKNKIHVTSGVAHVTSTFNNTIITISDTKGNTLAWSSSGHMGFKGSRKSTPYAAQVTADDISSKIRDIGIKSLEVMVHGSGTGWESAIRSFRGGGFTVTSIKNITGIPFNGCRPKKKRHP